MTKVIFYLSTLLSFFINNFIHETVAATQDSDSIMNEKGQRNT